MGKKDSSRKKARHAHDIVRNLQSVGRMRGTPLLEEGRLWLLGRCPDAPADPATLARILCAERLAERPTLVRALGAREAVALHAGRLGAWARNLVELESRRDIDSLLKEGVRPLRSYRGEDIPERIVRARQSLGRLSLLLPAVEAAARCQSGTDEEPAPEVLVRALPLRLYALGRWAVDPVEGLQGRDLPADLPLLHLACTTSDRGLANLAALLLGMRRRRTPGADRARIEGALPAHLAAAFQAGTAAPIFSPCLWALAADQALTEEPDLDGIPPGQLPPLARVTERIALLYGVPAALGALDNLARPLGAGGRRTAHLRQRLERLEQLVHSHQQGREAPAATPAERELLGRLQRVPAGSQLTARELVRLFLFWLDDGSSQRRPLGLRRLTRLAHAALSGGIGAAVRALGRAWHQTVTAQEQQSYETTGAAQEARLALGLSQPRVELLIPAEATADQLTLLGELLAGLSAERVREVWPVLIEHVASLGSYYWHDLVKSDLPAVLLDRALRHSLGNPARRFTGQPRLFARYLDCIESLKNTPLPNLDFEDDWFIDLFLSGKAWAPALVLALLGKTRVASSPREDLAALFALSRDLTAQGLLADHARALTRALDEWNASTVLQAPPQLPDLARALDLSPAVLEEYLHHRRLAGQGETFAQALLEPLHQAEQDAREAAFLAERLTNPALDPTARGHLATRLARLTDPQVAEAKRQKSARRARHRLERSRELLRQESLERVIDGVYREYLERHLGQKLPAGPLPAGLREAMHLLYAPNISQELMVSFLTDVIHGLPLVERPPNRTWLEQAQAAGLDTRAWLAGFTATVEVAGTLITFATEKNPLAVLKMGSFFDTCLSLQGGSNAASTLVNALDVNKQVIYGRKPDGTVAARKLIGATRAGELAGYRTYAGDNAEVIRGHLSVALAAFARSCKLRLSDQATPEVLHPGFWYDDGNEAWATAWRPDVLEAPPLELPQDARAASEWNLQQALAAGDARRLRALILHSPSPWREAALFRLLLHHPGAAAGYPWTTHGEEEQWTVVRTLTHRQGLSWLASPPGLLKEDSAYHLCNVLLDDLPCDAGLIEAAVGKVQELAQGQRAGPGPYDWIEYFRPPAYVALVPLDRLLDLYRAMSRLAGNRSSRGLEERDAWREHGADLLQTAWLRDQDAAPLVRCLADGGPHLTELVVELASREVIPGLETGLRRLLKVADPEREEAVALALGSQGDPRDTPPLLARLRRRPDSLALAVAVVRCGDDQAAEAARSLWRPPLTLDSSLGDRRWVSRVREVGSPRLARRLGRHIRRAIEELYRAGDLSGGSVWAATRPLLRQLALLGVSSPEGDPAVVMSRFLEWGPFAEAQLWWPEVVTQARELWLRVLQGNDLAERLDRSENEGARALEWYRACGEEDDFQHERFERRLRRLMVRGSGPERDRAVELWFSRSRDEQKRLRSGLLIALLGERRADLPEALRRELAVVNFEPSWLQHHLVTVLEQYLAWTAADPPSELTGEPFQDVTLYPRVNWSQAAAVFLLAQEGADPRRRAALEAFFRVWARTDPSSLLVYLNLAPAWLPPALAEPFLSRLLEEVNLGKIAADDVANHLKSTENQESYLFQRLLVQVLLPRFASGVQKQVIDELKSATAQERARWVLGQIEQQTGEPGVLTPGGAGCSGG